MGYRRESREKFRTRPRDWDREPLFPADDELLEVGARILNPLEVPLLPGEPRLGTTAYFVDSVLVAVAEAARVAELAEDQEWARRGWQLVPDREFVPVTAEGTKGAPLGVARFKVVAIDGSVLPTPVDAFAAVQLLRRRGLRRVGVEHVLVSTVRGHSSGHTEDQDEQPGSGRYRSSGGRLPVAYAGQPPARAEKLSTRRPVVGVLDTGCGEHDWLVDGVRRDVGYPDASGVLHPIGLGNAVEPPDPEQIDRGGDFEGPIDGVTDPFSGHGTFICGLIRQGCPNADIYSWRVVPSTGLIRESDVINALAGILNLVRSGTRIDVLNLSMGHYHELNDSAVSVPDRVRAVAEADPAAVELLQALSGLGVAVVCSAGNDATARPMFPAAYAMLGGLAAGWPVPITAVGSLNPNRATVSIRSNTGVWVSAYQPGTHVFSTLPSYQGGYEPTNRTRAFGWTRESVDPDDFTRRGGRGGFGLWNGTSFAAPIHGALIAAAVERKLSDGEVSPDQLGGIVTELAGNLPG